MDVLLITDALFRAQTVAVRRMYVALVEKVRCAAPFTQPSPWVLPFYPRCELGFEPLSKFTPFFCDSMRGSKFCV